MNKVINKLSKGLSFLLSSLNSNKYLTGIMVLLLNVGSRYVDFGFSKNQEYLLKNALTREIILFSAIFMSTRDLVLSFLLTASFIIMANHIFNEHSQYCIIPNKMNEISNLIDINDDKIITDKEERDAIEILTKVKKQKQKILQSNFASYLQNTI